MNDDDDAKSALLIWLEDRIMTGLSGKYLRTSFRLPQQLAESIIQEKYEASQARCCGGQLVLPKSDEFWVKAETWPDNHSQRKESLVDLP